MKSTYKIVWAKEATDNLQVVVDYLEKEWTERELNRFAALIKRKIGIIKENPFLYPISEKLEGARRALITNSYPYTTKFWAIRFRLLHYLITEKILRN